MQFDLFPGIGLLRDCQSAKPAQCQIVLVVKLAAD